MLLKNQHKVKLKKPYHKILYLYPALNDTFVFLGMVALRRDCVTHVDKDGNLLFEHIFPVPMDTFGMIAQDSCIMVQTRSKWYLGKEGSQEHETCITTLDLKTHQFRRTPFSFFNQESDQTHIRTFSDSKFVCIQEDGRYNDNRFKLSYFHYPMKQDDKPFNVYTSKDDEWTYQYIVKQANHHSMMAWFKARHDNEWEFKTYDLRDDANGKFNSYKFKQEIGVTYNMNLVQVALNNLWENTKGVFMLVCITNRTDNQRNKQLGVIQNNYVCDVTTGVVRQAKFSFGDLHDLQIDQWSLGRCSMFRTFDFKDGSPIETPVYYVNNQTEEIIAQQTWTCSYLHKEEHTGVDSDMAVHNTYENGDCEWFTCASKKIVNPKEISLFFLQSVYNNFDEDILQDVVQMIDYSQ